MRDRDDLATRVFDFSELAEQVAASISRQPESLRPGQPLDVDFLARVLEAMFWSSLDKYEGVPLRARLYIASSEALNQDNIFRFAEAVPINATSIRRYAPAHGETGGLVVAADKDAIEGILWSPHPLHIAEPHWLRIECTGTGSLRVSLGFLVLLTVVRNRTRFLGRTSFDRLNAALLLAMGNVQHFHSALFLMEIAHEIDRGGHGGALWNLGSDDVAALLPSQARLLTTKEWHAPYVEQWENRGSWIQLLSTPVVSGPHLEQVQWMAGNWDIDRQRAVSKAVANLARVDGAVVFRTPGQLHSFGVVHNDLRSPKHVLRVTTPQTPFANGDEVEASSFGGSRHRSAISFCNTFAPASAIVASHDGGLTVFAALREGVVVGSRVDEVSALDPSTEMPEQAPQS